MAKREARRQETLRIAAEALDRADKRRKKKKKRRKKKTPETSSSRSSCGRARRRHRQWFVPRWLRWFSSSQAVSPSFDGKLMLSGIMGALDEQDIYAVAAPVVDSGGGICNAGIAGCGSPRGTFLSFVVRPKMVYIMSGTTRRTVFCGHGTLSVDSGSGMCKACFACFYTSRCVPFRGWQAQMLGILAGMNEEDCFALIVVPVRGAPMVQPFLWTIVIPCCT